MSLKDDVDLGFKRIVELIKANRSGLGTNQFLDSAFSKANLPAGETILFSLPDTKWIANQLIDIDWSFVTTLPAQSPAGATAPTVTFRLKKGNMLLMQTPSQLLTWSGSRATIGRTQIATRDLTLFSATTSLMQTQSTGGYTNVGTGHHAGSVATNATVKDASPISLIAFVQNASSLLSVGVSQASYRRYPANPII